MSIAVSEEQPRKGFAPMEVRLSGSAMEVRPQLKKALSPMAVSPAGSAMEARDSQR